MLHFSSSLQRSDILQNGDDGTQNLALFVFSETNRIKTYLRILKQAALISSFKWNYTKKVPAFSLKGSMRGTE